MIFKKISVIIPVYGVEKYIAAAVQSALDQTYSNFELIIVDNASPDRSIEICQQFTDDRIRIIRQANRGPAGSRNTGIRHATGDYITFLDGDDLWMPEKLAKHVAYLERHPHVGISFCYSEFIDANAHRLGIYMTSKKLKGIQPSDMLCRCPLGNGSVSVYRREVFAAIRFQDNLYGTVEDFYFDESMKSLEDVECWFRMAIKSPLAVEGIPEVLTLYRIHSSGGSANIQQYIHHMEAVIEKARCYAPEIIATCERPFRAYQLRYAARRAVSLHKGKLAVRYIHQAIATHWRLLLEDPQRTLVTLAAAHILALIPKPLYRVLQSCMMAIVGLLQHYRIKQDALVQQLTMAKQPKSHPTGTSPFPPIHSVQQKSVSRISRS
jgi:glycosyltransferase involved in cell wall biosynthesis